MFVDFQLLTDQPGRPTDVEDQSVPLMTDVLVRSKPFPLTFSMKEVVEKEVQNMLEMGVMGPRRRILCPLFLSKNLMVQFLSVLVSMRLIRSRSLMLNRFQIRRKCLHN